MAIPSIARLAAAASSPLSFFKISAELEPDSMQGYTHDWGETSMQERSAGGESKKYAIKQMLVAKISTRMNQWYPPSALGPASLRFIARCDITLQKKCMLAPGAADHGDRW
jgi:hypothetical protein